MLPTPCFNAFNNKDEIMTTIKGVPLGASTVSRRVESLSDDVCQQLHQDLSDYECFSLQFDKSIYTMDVNKLIIFIHMAFEESTTKDFLTLLPLKERTRGEGVFN